MMTNSDLVRIINSDEVQSMLNAPKTSNTLASRKRNPLKRFDEMVKLNPYASVAKRAEKIAENKGGHKTGKRKAPPGGGATVYQTQKKFYKSMVEEPEEVVEEAAEEAAPEEAAAAPAEKAADLDDY